MSESSAPKALAVIMSVYAGDEPEYLTRSLSSIFCQDIVRDRPIHLYLGVDGPVGPQLWRILEEWRSKIYSFQPFERNRGLAYVLNDLIKSLQSEEYVFRMDADDESYPSRFSAQVEFMQTYPEVGICGTAINEKSVCGQSRRVTYPETHEEAMVALKWRSPFAHPTVCFRRSAVNQLVEYPTASANEDIAMWFKAASLGIRFGNLNDVQLDFRIADGFWHRRGIKKAIGELQTYWHGLRSLGASPSSFIFPLLRFGFRLMPAAIRKRLYASKVRS